MVGSKTAALARLSGLIKVEWDDKFNQPESEEVAGMLSRDIGSKVKDHVPMVAAVYGDLDPEHKKIVFVYLKVIFRFV